MRTACLVVALAIFSASSARAASYTIDPQQTMVVARTYKAGFAKNAGHDHAIRATELKGTIEHASGQPQSDLVEITVPVDKLVADDEAARAFAKLPQGPSNDDRAKIQKTMLGSGQLDAARFPTISFRSVKVEQAAGGNLIVHGQLTLHGTSRPVELSLHLQEQGEKLVADGRVDLRQSDFGIKPYGSFMGAVKNQDRVTLLLHVVAAR